MNMERFLGMGTFEILRATYIKVGRKPENREIFKGEEARLKGLVAKGLIKNKLPQQLEEIAAFNVGIKLSKKKID